ncbi:hypothetical protein ACWGLF_42285 [Streptomyces puniciscabiei]
MTFLADRMRQFVLSCVEQLHGTHLPGFRVPRVFAGHAVGAEARIHLVHVLGQLGAGGVASVAGTRVEDALRAVLVGLGDRPACPVPSHQVAETVARYGTFVGNPLLAPLTERQRDAVEAACACPPQLLLPGPGTPRERAAVLARLETARRRLGLARDTAVVHELESATRDLLKSQEGAHRDASPDGGGRYDLAEIGLYPLTAPLAERLGDVWAAGAVQALALVERLDSRVGGAHAWGRSAGTTSLCRTIELAALAARHRLVPDPEVEEWVGRADTAFGELRTWFSDGLVTASAHPDRLTVTLECLGRLGEAANAVAGLAGRPPARTDRDEIVWFDRSRNAGVWCYRSDAMAFVLPLVDGGAADYLAAPLNPGLFEAPADGDLVSWLPTALRDGGRFAPAGLPASVRKIPHGVEVEHSGWRRAGQLDEPAGRPELAGRRLARYRVEGRTLRVEEELRFDTPPEALALQIPETRDRPLDVRFEAPEDALVTRIDTSGLTGYCSARSELPAVHQVDLRPDTHVRFRWSVAPRPRMMSSAPGHEYSRGLYTPLAGRVAIGPLHVRAFLRDRTVLEPWDLFHLHWPERMDFPFEPDFHTALIRILKEHEVRIVWTQHNLIPHSRHPHGEEIYRAWARAADAVVHHSAWGRDLALRRYAYAEHTLHRVIPHGHFGNEMPEVAGIDRREVEESLGLRPGVLRLGVIGSPRKEKRVDLAMRAVAASARDDIELLVLSLSPEDEVPDDPRIVALPYELVTREEYNRRLVAIDVLVLPFDEDGDMLTTGTVGDAVGMGMPSLVSSWPFLAETLGEAGICYGSSADDLARCLDGLDAGRLDRARAAAKALQPRYDWSRVAEQFLTLLEDTGTARL